MKQALMKHFGPILLAVLLFAQLGLSAQRDSSWHDKPELSFGVFGDIFYCYDFNQPGQMQRQAFLYNHNRHNEVNVNLALVSLKIKQMKYRANFAYQAGTYVVDNYAAEPTLMRNIHEANIGVSLGKHNKLWLDVGVLPSHLGFESALSSQNPTLTRSLSAESSPYFMAGTKLTYTPNSKWEMAAMMLNGWQRIRRVPGNSLPAFGTQVRFTPNKQVLLNWSTFIGTDDPDSLRRMRYFSNLYAKLKVTKNLRLVLGFDLGVQEFGSGRSGYATWMSPVFIAQYSRGGPWKMALRAEYYQDPFGVIIPSIQFTGFRAMGYSLNIDYAPAKPLLCRLEARWFNSPDPIFLTSNDRVNNTVFVVASMAFHLADFARR